MYKSLLKSAAIPASHPFWSPRSESENNFSGSQIKGQEMIIYVTKKLQKKCDY
jgi:hypothetical protein